MKLDVHIDGKKAIDEKDNIDEINAEIDAYEWHETIQK